MKNDDMYRSLFCMAEEYNRIIGPLTKQLKIYDRWHEIASPLLRVAEMNRDVLAGVSRYDMALAHKLSVMIEPYQAMLDNMMAIENMLGTRFSELVKPQIYVPTLSSKLLQFGQAESQVAPKGIISGLVYSVSGIGSVTGEVASTAQIANPWLTDVASISAYETAFTDTHFGRLVETEKEVAGLSRVIEQYEQITSVSAQLASIGQITLNDAWKNAIAPPELLLELNDFALKQYAQIQKATDNQTIAWRLGLIDIASKYVDAQVSWGSELAVESEDDTPEAWIITPDFFELPKLLGHAKRDELDVEEAFNKSLFAELTTVGKLIIQKAKVVNEYCTAYHQPLLFEKDKLIDWGMTLSSAFCRDKETLRTVMDTLFEMFVRKPVIDLIGRQRCFDEISEYRTTDERQKPKITKIQRQVYYQIIGIEDQIIKTFEDTPSALFLEDTVSANVLKSLLNVQANRIYEGKNENAINDGIRDQLRMVYEIKDQTRQGNSVSGKDAGEIDLMLCDNGNPTVILEGLKLDSLSTDKLDEHINKALTNYDPIGCPLVYILIYATMKKFDEFWNKAVEYIRKYHFPYKVSSGFQEINTAFTESRHGKIVLCRNNKTVNVHLYAIAMK